MGEVVVSIIFRQSQQRDLVLPDHIPVHQLVKSLSQALGMPMSDEYYYELNIPDGDDLRRIPGSRTLQQAFILNGSYLHLKQIREDLSKIAYLDTQNDARFRLRQSTIIGRLTHDIPVDIDLTSLDSEKVISRRHAAITRLTAHHVIKDLNSHNGTFVNGNPLRKGESLVLHTGDEICFGSLEKGVRLRFTTPSV